MLFQIFQKSRSHFKNFGAKKVTRSKWYIEDPRVLCAKGKKNSRLGNRGPWLMQNRFQ